MNVLHLAHRRTVPRAVPSLELFPQLSELSLCILQSWLYVLDQEGIGETLAPWAMQALSSPELSTLSSLVTIDIFCLAQASLELTTHPRMSLNS